MRPVGLFGGTDRETSAGFDREGGASWGHGEWHGWKGGHPHLGVTQAMAVQAVLDEAMMDGTGKRWQAPLPFTQALAPNISIPAPRGSEHEP